MLQVQHLDRPLTLPVRWQYWCKPDIGLNLDIITDPKELLSSNLRFEPKVMLISLGFFMFPLNTLWNLKNNQPPRKRNLLKLLVMVVIGLAVAVRLVALKNYLPGIY
jgi:hypothetical protein